MTRPLIALGTPGPGVPSDGRPDQTYWHPTTACLVARRGGASHTPPQSDSLLRTPDSSSCKGEYLYLSQKKSTTSTINSFKYTEIFNVSHSVYSTYSARFTQIHKYSGGRWEKEHVVYGGVTRSAVTSLLSLIRL